MSDTLTRAAVTLDKKELNKKILRIALPIAIQGVVSATLSMIDDLMVGFLGETELASVGVGTQLTMVHYMMLFGFISGSATFMAQFYGAGDMKNIRKTVGFCQTLLIVVGVIFFAAANIFPEQIISIYSKDEAVIALATKYLRAISPQFLTLAITFPLEMGFKATQRTRIPLIVSVVVFSTNTVLNYVLIFGKFGMPALGVEGAAMATATARILQVIIDIIYCVSKRNVFRGSIKSYFGWSGEFARRVIKNSLPTTANEMLWGLGQTMYAIAFNKIGTTDYAAYQAANSIANIIGFAGFSVGDAALILIGEKLGEGKKEETWLISKHLIKIVLIVGAVIGALTMLMAKPFSGIFNLSDRGKQLTFYVMLVIGSYEICNLYDAMLVTGILRGGGDTKFAAAAEISCVWLVAVPMAFLGAVAFGAPIHIVYLMTTIEGYVKAAILTKRYLSKKWINNVIKGL